MDPKNQWWWWDIEFRDGKIQIGKWWWLLGFAPNNEDHYELETLGL